MGVGLSAGKKPGVGPIRVFLSYSHADEALCAQLKKHLRPLVHTNRIEIWFDREISGGAEWEQELTAELETAELILLLISSDFTDSDYCYGKELLRAMERHEAGLARVVPVRVRPSLVDGLPFSKLQWVPRDDKPVTKWGDRDEAWVAVGKELTTVVEELEAERDKKAEEREAEVRHLEVLIKSVETKANLYSPLAATAASSADEGPLKPGVAKALAQMLPAPAKHVRRGREGEAEQTETHDDVLPALASIDRAVILGDPGGGKSTTLRKLAMDRAGQAQNDESLPLPVFVALGDWTDNDEPLEAFLARQAAELGERALALSAAGRVAWLLDGLNEMPTVRRGEKVGAICRFVRELPDRGLALLSCRREDYEGELELDTLTLEPLSPQRIRRALWQWFRDREVAERLFWQLAGSEELAGVFAKWMEAGATEEQFWSVSTPGECKKAYDVTTVAEDNLWSEHVGGARGLLGLAANPFLFGMLVQVWAQEQALPDNRGELFRRSVALLLEREGLAERETPSRMPEPTADGQRLLDGLAALAWKMQRDQIAGGDDAEEYSVRTVLGSHPALDALGGPLGLKLAMDATIVEGTTEIRFRHQLLQEYFTAVALRERWERGTLGELWARERWWERSGWEEACVLLAGLYSDDCTEVIGWLADVQPEVAADCLLRSGAEVADRAGLERELRDLWMPRMVGPRAEAMPEARAAVGLALGRLGLDDRPGVGVMDGVPDIDWVEIAGGEFVYQEGEWRTVDGFAIGRYPVTNAQFAAFVEAEDGYAEERWWVGMPSPNREPRSPEWSEGNAPRETVSWYEAVAFCRWLSARLGKTVRLPKEWEWERAARGTEGREYPWGEGYEAGRANINETWADDKVGPHNLRRTSPVGIYGAGATPEPEGLLDLAGNVWEWCLNEHDNPENLETSGEGGRAVRGGSWYGNSRDCRPVIRGADGPGNRGVNLGFRCVGE